MTRKISRHTKEIDHAVAVSQKIKGTGREDIAKVEGLTNNASYSIEVRDLAEELARKNHPATMFWEDLPEPNRFQYLEAAAKQVKNAS